MNGQSIGNAVWNFNLDGTIHSQPCIAPDGTIYFGTGGPNGNGYFYALNPDGTLKWKARLLDVDSSPVLGINGTIYVNNANGTLQALNPSGSVIWTFLGMTGDFSPALAKDGTIYIPSNVNSLLAINSNGTAKWAFQVESGYFAICSPVVASDGTIYCGFYNSGTSSGRLYAINANGTAKWHLETGGVSILPR